MESTCSEFEVHAVSYSYVGVKGYYHIVNGLTFFGTTPFSKAQHSLTNTQSVSVHEKINICELVGSGHAQRHPKATQPLPIPATYHQKSIFKAIITGELTRFVWTNHFTAAKGRGYPEQLINKTLATVTYSSRQELMKDREPPSDIILRMPT